MFRLLPEQTRTESGKGKEYRSRARLVNSGQKRNHLIRQSLPVMTFRLYAFAGLDGTCGGL